MRRLFFCGILGLLASCESLDPAAVGGQPQPKLAADDPLALPETGDRPAAGSLDDLHQRVIVRSCAGQPGLCHAGQFEPNLSTPALAYANLVYRPSLEKEKDRLMRVVPRDAQRSVLVMKLRGTGVATRMPLGAAPLPEEEIRLFEQWINGGALRRPGSAPPPRLNNPPLPPDLGVFSDRGERLGQAGPALVEPGTTLTFRHSVNDFETPEEQIPFALFTLSTNDGRNVLLTTDPQIPHLGLSRYDPAGAPPGTSLNWRFSFTIPAMVKLLGQDGQIREEPASGMSFNVLALYVDSEPVDTGISTFAFRQDLIRVK